MGAPRAARVAWAPRAATGVRAERLGVNGARWRFEAMAYLSMVAPLGRVLVAVASSGGTASVPANKKRRN